MKKITLALAALLVASPVLGDSLPFPLNYQLGTLADGLGCFPFDDEA